jgi:hypothetical protein
MILTVPGRRVAKAEEALAKIGEKPIRIGSVIEAKRGRPRVEYF